MSTNGRERRANGSPKIPFFYNALSASKGERERRTAGSPFAPRKNSMKSMGERRTGRTYIGVGARSRRPANSQAALPPPVMDPPIFP